ncbi:MAG: PAS domain-containing protein [Alphaproteobacteria bacterium]|nr:PAS domain-containing protein [Alphaproteobacteria bacterium]
MTFLASSLSRKPAFAYALEALLLLVSAVGFWLWRQDGMNDLALSYLFGVGLAPLMLFVFVAVKTSAGQEHLTSSRGFQSRIDQLQTRLNAQDDFFRSIADYTPSPLSIFDSENQYWFVNASAARSLGRPATDISGKKPAALLGAELGRQIERTLDAVRASGKPQEILSQDRDAEGNIRYLQTNYRPLSASGDFPGGVMAREEDVTSILTEREHRESQLRQVISTLVAVVDRRDPYASGHSARTGQLSRALAEELQLTPDEIEAAEIAGSLMNFGKVLVSRAILTKTDSLTQAELQRIRDGILTSADILSLIEFSSPVVPTLRQVLERHDGAGAPYGLKGDTILVTARIVAVANAFVALVSPRAYRPGAELMVAAQRLGEDAGKAFDPRVIAALQSYINKNADKLEWLSINKPRMG